MYQTHINTISNDLANASNFGKPLKAKQNLSDLSWFGNLELETESKTVGKRTVLLMNCDDTVLVALKKCLSGDNYEMLNTNDTDLTHKTIESICPEMLVLGVESFDDDVLVKIKSIKSNPPTSTVPVVVCSAQPLSLEEADILFSAGAMDCISGEMTEGKLCLRLKSMMMQVNALNAYREREQDIRTRHGKLTSELEQLQQKVESGQREALAHLELLIHSKEVKESIVEKINDLRPYLNVHGKAKLKQLTRQIKWELSEEDELSLERKFDESNFDFYHQLEAQSADLTRYEMRLCAYLRSNNSSADIARITKKTANCINVAFARIRTKLSLKNNNELKAFLKGLKSTTVEEPAMA